MWHYFVFLASVTLGRNQNEQDEGNPRWEGNEHLEIFHLTSASQNSICSSADTGHHPKPTHIRSYSDFIFNSVVLITPTESLREKATI